MRRRNNDHEESRQSSPLNCAPPLSRRGRFVSPPFCAAAARFSEAKRSRPRVDARGVGGSRGFAGWRKVCGCCPQDQRRDFLKIERQTDHVLPHKSTRSYRFWFEYVVCVVGHAELDVVKTARLCISHASHGPVRDRPSITESTSESPTDVYQDLDKCADCVHKKQLTTTVEL